MFSEVAAPTFIPANSVRRYTSYLQWVGGHLQHSYLRPGFLGNIHSTLEMSPGSLFIVLAIGPPQSIQGRHSRATPKHQFSSPL